MNKIGPNVDPWGYIKENPKEFYSYVNNNTTVRSEIAVLKNRNGELAILPHEKADMLNNYFASVFFTKEDTDNIPEPEPYGAPFSHLFTELKISPIEVHISAIQLQISSNRLNCRYCYVMLVKTVTE